MLKRLFGNGLSGVFRGCFVCLAGALAGPLFSSSAVVAGEASGEVSGSVSAAKARENFEVSYKAGVAAMAEKDWMTAEVLFAAAVQALGDVAHPNKIAAETLLKKARSINQSRAPTPPVEDAAAGTAPPNTEPVASVETKAAQADAPAQPNAVEPGAKPAEEKEGAAARGYADFNTALAEGLDKLEAKAWADAEKAFEAALRFKPEDAAARAGLGRAKAHLPEAKPAEAAPGVSPAGAEKTSTPVVSVQPSLPKPEALERADWQKGAGSPGIWAGQLYHLDGGDMKYRHKLKGDFQALVSLEARMDHRSRIYLDLRPVDNKVPRVRGYGSKDGSGPYLEVDKGVAGRSGGQPASAMITLGFIRSGKQISFYCNGERVAETWDVPADAELYLWVCDKGTMNAAKVVSGE